MLTGGRILVAVVGAVVLAVVAVFIVRSVWWDTASKEQPLPMPTATTQMASGTPETSASQPNTEGNPDGSGGGTDQTSMEQTSTEQTGETTTTESTEHVAPYTATSEQVRRILGTVVVDVELPQVQGGAPDVAKVFNDQMQKVLETQADSLAGGTLESQTGSGVRIGKQVLSGLLRTAATDFRKGTSTALAGTVVVDAESGSFITLSSLFKDEDTGLRKLAELAQELGPTTSVGADFTSTNLQPTEKVFEHWTAESKGMRVYFAQGLVAPESQGIVELTVPWDDLGDVLKPGVAQIVSS